MDAVAANVVGVDLAKNVFQAYWVEPETGEIKNVAIRRAKFLQHFVNRAPCVVGMEACGGAQHWARELVKLGHEVVVLPAKSVKAFVSGNTHPPPPPIAAPECVHPACAPRATHAAVA